MSTTLELLLGETRESFFHLENLGHYLDAKAFGLVAIDTAIIYLFVYFSTLFVSQWHYLFYAPILVLGCSILLTIKCIQQREWPRIEGNILFDRYRNSDSETLARKVSATYAKYENAVIDVYENKQKYFRWGIYATWAGVGVEMLLVGGIVILPLVVSGMCFM